MPEGERDTTSGQSRVAAACWPTQRLIWQRAYFPTRKLPRRAPPAGLWEAACTPCSTSPVRRE